jgi:hypothetical protein
MTLKGNNSRAALFLRRQSEFSELMAKPSQPARYLINGKTEKLHCRSIFNICISYEIYTGITI